MKFTVKGYVDEKGAVSKEKTPDTKWNFHKMFCYTGKIGTLEELAKLDNYEKEIFEKNEDGTDSCFFIICKKLDENGKETEPNEDGIQAGTWKQVGKEINVEKMLDTEFKGTETIMLVTPFVPKEFKRVKYAKEDKDFEIGYDDKEYTIGTVYEVVDGISEDSFKALDMNKVGLYYETAAGEIDKGEVYPVDGADLKKLNASPGKIHFAFLKEKKAPGRGQSKFKNMTSDEFFKDFKTE
jgi:hypothetical protein